MTSTSPCSSILASQRICRACSVSPSCAEVIASAAAAAAALVSDAPGDLPASHGGGHSLGTDSTDSNDTLDSPEGRLTRDDTRPAVGGGGGRPLRCKMLRWGCEAEVAARPFSSDMKTVRAWVRVRILGLGF